MSDDLIPYSLRDDFKDILWWDRQMRQGTGVSSGDFKLRDKLVDRHHILILSEFNAQRFHPPEGLRTVLFRIKGPFQGEFKELQADESRFEKICYAEFFDLDVEDTIDAKTADHVMDQLLSLPPHDLFAIHCYAGISRSSATALIYASLKKQLLGKTRSKQLEIDQNVLQLLRECQLYAPNRFVVQRLLEAFARRVQLAS